MTDAQTAPEHNSESEIADVAAASSAMQGSSTQLFRALPSVDACLHALGDAMPILAGAPRILTRDAVNAFLEDCRLAIRAGQIRSAEELALNVLLPSLIAHVAEAVRPRLRRVLNATGVVLHTNLGRAVLAPAAAKAVQNACAGYCNLEFDLDSAERGSRYSLVEKLLCQVTGAEAAMVVNNNAAAVLLTLDSLCRGREVIVSRGELVEIGGSFRIPDVMARTGAHLCEVGTTNRTHLRDYEQAIHAETAALMRVHTSNYRIIGFQTKPATAELVRLGQEHGLPVIEDLGSGSLMDLNAFGLPDEPTVREVVDAGVDIVTFSGDKVLGGPQAGIIVGKKQWIDRLKSNQLSRALRIDKMTLAALEATLRLYLEPERAMREIPTLRMLTTPVSELTPKARRLAARLRRVCGQHARISTLAGVSRVGGGSFPERDLPTMLVALEPYTLSVAQLRHFLLHTEIPVVGRVEHDQFCFDVRTLTDVEFPLLARFVGEAFDSLIAH